MKKLYSTLALACTVALGASAIAPAQLAKAERNLEFAKFDIEAVAAAKASATKAPAAKAVAIDDVVDVCGLYKWHAWDNRGEAELDGFASINYLDMGNMVSITGYASDIEAEIDPDAGTLNIEAHQFMYKDKKENMDFYLEFLDLDAQTQLTSVTATWNGTKFVFPENVLFASLSAEGYTLTAYEWGANVLEQYVDKTAWKNAGTAEFLDGWFLTQIMDASEIEASKAELTNVVTLQVDPANPNRYSLLNPYKNNFLSIPFEYEGQMYVYNADETAEGRIIIDVTDPDFVQVQPATYAGYASDDSGNYYPFNEEGYMVQQLGFGLAEAKEAFGDNTASTYKDGMVTLTNLYFGIGNAPLGLYSWQDKNGNPVPMTTYVKLTINTGVEDAFIGAENAPVEYYNLQGVRVANPENGLYIRRQGNTATKVLVK